MTEQIVQYRGHCAWETKEHLTPTLLVQNVLGLCLVVILECSTIATVDSGLQLTIIFLVLVEGKAYLPSCIDIYIQRKTGKHKNRAGAETNLGNCKGAKSHPYMQCLLSQKSGHYGTNLHCITLKSLVIFYSWNALLLLGKVD